MRIGFLGSVEQFNNRIERAVLSHRKIRGFDPPPGLALDLARSQVPDVHFEDMIRVGSSAVGRAVGALAVHAPVDPKEEFLRQYTDARVKGTDEQFLKDNQDRYDLYRQDKGFEEKFTKAYLTGARQHAAGVISTAKPTTLGDTLNFAFKGVNQITTGLVIGPPTLAWEEGRAGYHDVGAVAHGNVPTHLAKTNVQLAKGVAKGVVQDVKDPRQNPGYLILDIFGFASGGAGAVTRIAKAGTAVARGEGAAAAARGLVERPRGGRMTMQKGEHTEERLGSENMLVNAVQRITNKTRNARMALRSEGEPAGFLSVVQPARARDFLERYFEPLRKTFGDEAKMRREGDARRQVEHDLSMMQKADLEKTAGWALHTARAWDRVPAKMRKGLTVGEQKALQVITLDDPNPMKWWTDFHNRQINMGIGHEASHRAQLAALKLAAKAIENPSKRYRAVVRKYYDVISETERLRIEELGLAPDIAERRVINAGRIVRGEELLKPEEPTPLRQNPSAAYTPFFSKEHTKRPPSERGQRFEVRQGPYGLSIPQDINELHHQFTGESLTQGRFRLDATTLAGEGYARTVRSVATKKQHEDIWNMSVPERVGTNTQFIRDIREVTGKMKETLMRIEGSDLTGKEIEGIDWADLDALRKFLYPEHPTKMDNGRWFDPALLTPDHAPAPTILKKASGYMNEPFRFITLYARPAYILNAVGQAAMNVLHQGHHAPPNMVRSIMSTDFYGEKVARALDTLAGETRAKSYTDSRVKLASSLVAQGWSKVSDQYFRRAAVIHELKRLGFDIPLRKLTAEERAKLEHDLSNKADEATRKNVVEAKRRAGKAGVEFDNLTWFEREYLKHFIFVYPWVSRSLVWSVRTVVEHPMKADILAQVGHEMDDEHPELYKKVPEWFAKTGYIPIGFDKEGNPKVVNPTSVNSFSTLAQLQQTVQAGFDGSPGTEFNAAFDLLGPMAKILVHGFTGRDDFGNPYPGSDWLGAAQEALTGLPQVAAYERSNRTDTPVKAGDVTNRNQLVQRLNANLHRTVFSPGWADGYGMLVTGGLTPRSADKQALIAKYWGEQTPEKRHGYERQLIHKALGIQADLLKQRLPSQVREAVDISLELSWRHSLRAKELGRTPTELERTNSDIAYLTSINRMPKADAATLAKKAKKFTDPQELARFHSALLDQYTDAKVLQQWDSDVRYVAAFTKPILEARLQKLGAHTSIKTITATQAELYDAGRQALAYRRQVKKLHDESAGLPSAESDPKQAEFRAWQDKQDKPIMVNGKVVAPSPVRLAWAELTDQERGDHLRATATRGWGSMSNFDKELLGKKVPAAVSAAWAEISKAKAQYKETNYVGVQADQVLGLVRQLEKYKDAKGDKPYAGILADYLFSRKPLFERLEVLPIVAKSPNISEWRSLFSDARTAATAIRSGDYVNAEVRLSWREYVKSPEFQSTLDKAPGFRKELDRFGPNLLTTLIS